VFSHTKYTGREHIHVAKAPIESFFAIRNSLVDCLDSVRLVDVYLFLITAG
jgi:hypothetical protein